MWRQFVRGASCLMFNAGEDVARQEVAMQESEKVSI